MKSVVWQLPLFFRHPAARIDATQGEQDRAMIVLGIVGSPAGGKSTVARHLEDLGATWINADEIARSVLEQDDVQRELLSHFGSEIAGSDGRIDRSQLASRVFGDDDSQRLALTYLESVIHPPTRRLILGELIASHRSGKAVAVLDVPLMFESGWDRCCDEIWCVDADPSLRLERARSRNWDEPQLRAREANQLDIDKKKRLSTAVIMNNGSLEQLYETTDRLWRSLVGRHQTLLSDSHCYDQDASGERSSHSTD
jgi:dephospho-CoA kinase